MLLFTTLTALASWTLDLSSAPENVGAWAVRQHGEQLCDTGGDRALAVAAVVYAKKGGLSSWGHASVRVLACEDGVLEDYEYEAYKMGPDDRERLAEAHGARPFLEDRTYLRSQHGRLVLYRNRGTVDHGWFGDAIARNREIYELWLPVSPAGANRMWRSLDGAWRDQVERLEARSPLAEIDYRWWSTNCTLVLQSSLPVSGLEGGESLGERRYPFALLRALEVRPDVHRVVHPSADLLARLSRRAGSVDALVTALDTGMMTLEERTRPAWRSGKKTARSVLTALGEDALATWVPEAVAFARHSGREDDSEPPR